MICALVLQLELDDDEALPPPMGMAISSGPERLTGPALGVGDGVGVGVGVADALGEDELEGEDEDVGLPGWYSLGGSQVRASELVLSFAASGQ